MRQPPAGQGSGAWWPTGRPPRSPGGPDDRHSLLSGALDKRSAARSPAHSRAQARAREEKLRDHTRQIVVTMAAACGVLGLNALTGRSGARSADDVAGGAMAGDATVLASASPAPVWLSMTALALVAWAAWQLLPGATSSPRQRAAGWWMAAAMVLMTLWLLLAGQGWLWLSVGALVALTACLERVVRGLELAPPRSRAEAVVVDGIPGGFLGWCLVGCPSAALAAASPHVAVDGAAAEVAGVVSLAVVGLVAGWLVLRTGRVAIAVGAAWGLLLVAAARLTLGPESVAVVAVAVVSAAKCVGALVIARRRGPG